MSTDRTAHRALLQRLTMAMTTLELPVAPGAGAGKLLDALVTRVAHSRDRSEAWLVVVALSTVFPTSALVTEFLRELETSSTTRTTLWLLKRCLPLTRSYGRLERELRVVSGGVVVDVDFSARNEHNSGIQRVVRNTLPVWEASHGIQLVAWEEDGRAWRDLGAVERHRVLAWGEPRRSEASEHRPSLVVPWRSTVLLVEIPVEVDRCLPLAGLAECSGNRVVLVGYDAIPIVSAETMPLGMSDHFAKYLAIVKHVDSIAAISHSSAEVFAGFADMLSAQGLAGPEVVPVLLPAEAPRSIESEEPASSDLVLCVGNREPRKNHVMVIAAAERLWAEGLDFELRLIGSAGWDNSELRSWIRRAQRAGRRLSVLTGANDDTLAEAYRDARFSVFVSIEEGYGLPVAESLAFGTPVLVTEYGSTAEIAANGGCLLVDPRDDDAIHTGMRDLLTSDDLIGQLRAEARNRTTRSWEEYAQEMWERVVAP